MPRKLVIDANLAKRLATELKGRGRDAISVHESDVGGHEDPELLQFIAQKYADQDWVLVTGDDAMPDEHGDVIEHLGVTVATVDGRWERHGMEQEAYKREVVHRWAHRMAEQEGGEIRRYSPTSNRTWTRRTA